ncbi:hypothetical protein EJ05DRAFT_479841 [Pseudovirgaria hyperparasitica]|uniref:Uncharacterized protein n=1 Tax=Pseudovirgaria hyperparasitica TaxID=470096 RepID=A0A6A6VYF4_9PEZI|nr:uncharacterized protein EJ05DRAFT_479841 [Pseudovirgaria hyperparasitica]KAF2754327.1 hypothetical protein EJ05DRAFT_479841 [Pseudovirgaria hyperparasitica]
MADSELSASNNRPISTTPIPLPGTLESQSNGEPTMNGDSAPTVQSGDVEMKDEPMIESAPAPAPTIEPEAESTVPSLQAQPAPTLPAMTVPTQAATPPAVTPTYARNSPHPAPQVNIPAPPVNPNPHGSPTRVYLNQQVTPYLLEAMKMLVTHEPEKPLKYLADYLAEKSRELEGV